MNFLKRLFAKEVRTVETVSVNEHLRQILSGVTDVQTALNIPAVSACVDFIAGKIAELPIKLYRYRDGKTTEMTHDNRLYLLNDCTGDLLDPYQMKFAIVRDYLLSGTGYIYPEMLGNEFLSLRYIDPLQVTVSKNYDPIFKLADYHIGTKTFPDHEIMRICRNTKDGVTGIGIIEEHPDILNAAYKQIVYERYLVERGGNKKGFIQVDDRVTQEVLDDLKQKWQSLYSSDNSNMMVLNKGLKFVESSNTSVEMQLNESKDTNNELICQIFGLSAAVISGKATDEQYISAIKTAVMPVVAALQAALDKSMLLPSERSDHYFILDTKELLKGDILKRYQAYEIALKEGFLQVDEVRYEEDREPFNLNWIKLGLQDVLFDTKNHTIYTPNTNQTVKFGEFSIDKQDNNGIMETRYSDSQPRDDHGRWADGGDGSSSGSTESGISGKHDYANSQNSVDLEYLKSEEYKNKFKGITGNTKVDEQLYKQSKAMLTHRNGTDKEDMCLIDSRTGKIAGHQSNSKVDFGVEYNSSIENAIKNNPRDTLISIHNHSTNNPPTGSDFVSNGSNGYKLGLVVTHNGKVFTYKAGKIPFTADSFGITVNKYRRLDYNEFDAIIQTLSDYTQQYGIEWSER